MPGKNWPSSIAMTLYCHTSLSASCRQPMALLRMDVLSCVTTWDGSPYRLSPCSCTFLQR